MSKGKLNRNYSCLFNDPCKDHGKTVIILAFETEVKKCETCGAKLKMLGISSGGPMIKNADRDGRTRL